MNVLVNLIVLYLLDERFQIFIVIVWIDLEWIDVYLIWNGSEYNNIQFIIIFFEKIWNLDICVINEVINNKCFVRLEDGKVLLEYIGKVIIWWNKEVKIGCDVDIS